MPLVAIALISFVTVVSLMPQPKLFQSFQPICGVKARPLVEAWEIGAGISASRKTESLNKSLKNSPTPVAADVRRRISEEHRPLVRLLASAATICKRVLSQ